MARQYCALVCTLVLSVTVTQTLAAQKLCGRARDIASGPATPKAAFVGVTLGEDLNLFNPIFANEDRNYTGGAGISFSPASRLNRPTRAALGLAEKYILRCALMSAEDQDFSAESATLGLTAFTPDELQSSDVVRGDRPYASTLILTSRRLYVSKDRKTAVTSEFAFGILGLHLARNAQRYIHKVARKHETRLTPYDPKGWGNQISDGGELTAMISVAAEHELASVALRGQRYFDITSRSAANVGYYTDAATGLNIRLGVINTGFYSFLPSALNNAVGLDGTGSNEAKRKIEIALFAQGRTKATAYNALLQGQLRPTNYRVRSFRRLTGEWDMGATGMLPVRDVDFRWTYTFSSGRTSELYGEYSRPHTWGGITLGFSQPLPR